MNKVLVLATNYPNNEGGVALRYIHTRNEYYVEHDIEVTVLNFSSNNRYEKDGINVISLTEYENTEEEYDTLILHAPNIRYHYSFLRKYEKKFKRIIFFFHGHEVLRLNKTYPKPYEYMRTSGLLRRILQECYDVFKLTLWKNYLPKIADKSDFIFVSRNFFEEFKKYTGLNDEKLKNNIHIIHNSVGSVFEQKNYNREVPKNYDFITIRNMLDESVYCIDLLCKIAKLNPKKKFLLIGRGDYFKYNEKPCNIEWVDTFLSHNEMLNYVDESKIALMLTRRDTQGVMTSELAVYGIPVITSDIPICREMFEEIDHVRFIKNNLEDNLDKISHQLQQQENKQKCYLFSYENTVKKEEILIKNCK